MLALNHLQSFLFIVAITSFGFSLSFNRGKVNAHTTPYRIATLICITLFCFGLGAIFCQIASHFSLTIPLFIGSATFAVLVRNCSEMAEDEYPDREARVLGVLSMGGVLLAGL